jgi:putative chitinase
MILSKTSGAELQRRLNDGGFGPLVEDGVVGGQTLAALFRYMGAGRFASVLGATASRDFADFQINSALRIAHWVAQFAHESAHFTRFEEGLSYSAERLCAVWPRRFPTIAAAQEYARDPEGLANKVYGGRMGNSAPGDGWRYRGRGPQITGRENYKLAERGTGLPLIANPGLAALPENFTLLACDYWDRQSCNRMADRDDLIGITEAVNGGRVGLADRRALLLKCLKVMA